MRIATFAGRLRAMLFSAGVLMALSHPLAAQNQGHQEHARQPKNAQHAPQSQRPDHHEMHDDVRHLRGLKGADLERTFLTSMMDHHQSGISMARLAVQKAHSPELRRIAQKMVANQTKEIGQMQQYLSRWYKIKRTAKSDPRMQETMQRLQALSGAAFDRAFVQEMSRHHESGILMAEPVRARATHKELRQLATKIATGQRKEQQEMRKAIA